ncbi:MAG: hypothetical protein FJZ01_12810 [Candidatus Sericytochromatia bacterium]|nr:hypothetical protein [Candidatus Tanganyikabacteria bacterium]
MLAYTPSYPDAPPAPPPAIVRPFDTCARAGYGLRSLDVGLAGARVAGLADNVLDVQGQFRAGDWLFGLTVWRLKAPITAPTVSEAANPALTPETSQIRLRAGYAFGLDFAPLVLEAAPSLALVSQEGTSGGSGLPLTATTLDYAQTRLGVGLEVPVALAIGTGIEVHGRGAVFPAAGARLDKAPYRFDADSLMLAETYAGVRFKLIGGLDAEIGAGYEAWTGTVTQDKVAKDFKDSALTYTAGLIYRPERVGR